MLDVVETLAVAVDAVASAVEGAEAASLSGDDARVVMVGLERQRARLEAATGALADRLDQRGLAHQDGAHDMAGWLTARTGQARATASSRLRLARALRVMSHTACAFAEGSLTADHVRVLARARNPRTIDAFTRDEAVLVGHAQTLSADALAQLVEHWLRRADADGARPRIEGDDGRLYASRTLAGRYKGTFDLGGSLALTVERALDEVANQLLARDRTNHGVDPADPGLGHSASQRRARALGEVCGRAAAAASNPTRRQPLLTVHTTLDTLTEAGSPEDWMLELEHAWRAVIPHHDIDLLTCDCWVGQVVVGAHDGQPLHVGRDRRIATRAIRRGLVARDGSGCAVPGCDRPTGWCDAHHIVHWRHGGHTDIDNMVHLCRWHHQRIHAAEITVDMAGGRPTFTNRYGRILAPPGRGLPPPRLPIDDVAERPRPETVGHPRAGPRSEQSRPRPPVAASAGSTTGRPR